MSLSYVATPFLAWLVAGSLKFGINTLRSGNPAFGLIGYGGFPSNHSSIVSSMCALIAFQEGMGHPAFGVSLTFAFIVILDASSLRREVGRQAVSINKLTTNFKERPLHRERMGHTPFEIAGGVFVGIAVAAGVVFLGL